MLRDCDLNEISDGRRYLLSDMVKADCHDCKGCSACCHDMGTSIVLDPLDFYRISSYLKYSFEAMLNNQIELNIVDGLILPNLKMAETHDKPCVFLNESHRCAIHPYRPGICRIFPLGRLYENNSFSYILQTKECLNDQKSKIKVSKWIDTPNVKQNQHFITDWHYFLKELHERLLAQGDEAMIKKVTMQLLHFFYIEPYQPEEDFYTQFYTRFANFKSLFL